MINDTHKWNRSVIILMGIQVFFSMVMTVLLICMLFGVGSQPSETTIPLDTEISTEITDHTSTPATDPPISIEPPNIMDDATIPEIEETIPDMTEDDETISETEETIPETEPSVEKSPEVTEPPTTKATIPSTDNDDELEMLACVIYQEAGGDAHCDDCRRRVADVVLNRIADPRFPNTMYEVLTAKSQYGRFYWTSIVWPDRHTDPYEKNAVERAYRIAEEVLNGRHSELYGNGYVWQASFTQSDDNIYCCGHYFGR